MGEASEDDSKAILQLIEAETAAYWKRDYEAWARCWVHAPHIRRAGWWRHGGVTYREGWSQIAARMLQFMDQNPAVDPAPVAVRRANINIRVGHEMAWMTYDEHAPETGDRETDLPGLSRETRILEKHGGQWKIAYSSYLYRSFETVASALVRVDGQSVVEWMNPAAQRALEEGCGLELRDGRLRAHDPASDQRLLASIGWAARLDEGVEARRGALPVVLDGGRGEPARVSWIIADSGMIHVSINDQRLAGESLEAAARIYGMSAAQVRLAECIIAGCDLKRAAERLNVSVSTARTQLGRIFDKTGVRSQPELVRALLSVAAPVA